MTVQACRTLWSKREPYTSKTMAFCDQDGLELHGKSTLLSSNPAKLEVITVTDYAFKRPIYYTAYKCSKSEDRQILDRLNGSIDLNVKYKLHREKQDGDDSSIIIYQSDSELLSTTGDERFLVAIPKGRMLTSDSILSRLYGQVFHCNENGLEDVSGKTGPSSHVTVTFMAQHPVKLKLDMPVCPKSSVRDLKLRLNKIFGNRLFTSATCNDQECPLEEPAISFKSISFNHIEDVSKLLLLDTYEWCRGCTLSLSIAIIMFLNAAFFLGMAIHMRHRDGELCECRREVASV
jgi:hypothetical protein